MPCPLPLAWKPNWVLAPGATVPLYCTFVNWTAPLVPLGVALQVLVIAAPLGSVIATRQPRKPDEPAVTVTVATNPVFHWLSETEAEQAPPVGGGDDAGGVVTGGVETGGGEVEEPALRAFSVEVYAGFLLPFASKSNGVSPLRHESLSRMPHVVIPVHRDTARQARTTLAYVLACAVPEPAMSSSVICTSTPRLAK